MNAVVAIGVKIVKIEDQTIMMDTKGGKYYCCNHIGGIILGRLVENATFPEIVAAVQEKYRQPNGLVEADVRRFLNDLSVKSLCRIGSVEN